MTLLATVLMAGAVAAKPVNLYEQPMANAKVVGSIDSESSMVPILSSQDGSWMKVGDPRNGNVGWIKMGDVSNTTMGGVTSSAVSMTEKTVNTDKGPQTYRTIQFGTPKALNAADANKMAADMQKTQQQIEQQTMQAIQTIFNNANAFYQANPELYKTMHLPIVVPVMVVPVMQPAPGAAPAKAMTTPSKS
jgi:hypothetical protein